MSSPISLSSFFAQIAPALQTTTQQLMAYAAEDAIGGYDPHVPVSWIVGSVWEVEGQALYAIVRALKPLHLLEIGTRRGCSTTHLLSALEANGVGELVSLDIERFLGQIPEALQARWTFVQTDALAWLRETRREFDFVFEDGAHSYEFTREVLALCQRFSAGLTLSHDAEHFLVGEDIRHAWVDVFGAGTFQTALIAPSDCGFAYQFAPPVTAAADHPLLSIVSGTVNRLPSLMAMVGSVRRQLADSLAYEFVLVDGGSTDGTLEWGRKQPDVRLIEQGELLGAIRAFDAGAEAARGKYVLLANDDVTIHDGAILRALAHLNDHPGCGAVAFADDRKAPGYEDGGYHVQTISGHFRDGKSTSVVYAQIGLFRRWLGELAGWWGSRDSEWGESHTYGGDARLSARLWELGYTVEAVEGVNAHDGVARDDLRQHNQSEETRIGSAYYRKYPTGVPIDSRPQPANPQYAQLRILMATLYDRGFGHYKHGLKDAFARIGWTIEVDWLGDPDRLVSLARAWQPHVLFTQMCDPALMARLREAVPSGLIVNWYGDVHSEMLLSPDMLRQCAYVDLQLVVNADVLPRYAAEGIQAAYWQIGFEPVDAALPTMPSHDLLFQANAYSPSRKALGAFLRQLDPNAGLYGSSWDKKSGETLYDFARGAALYRNCKIAIGDNQYRDQGFVSNRFFEATANGAFLLHQEIPGLEALTGYVDGKHYVSWKDHADLRAKVRFYLEHDDECQRIAAAGEAFTRAWHSFDARVWELFEVILPKLTEKEISMMAQLDQFKQMAREGDYLVLDTETTGLERGEIVQIAVIDANGAVLLDTVVKPVNPIPPDASNIHGLYDQDVADAPTWAMVSAELVPLLTGRNVIIYNAIYDRKMMHQSAEAAGLPKVDWKTLATFWCAMTAFAEVFGDFNDYRGNYRWQKLAQAAKSYGIQAEHAHTALGDCLTTLNVVRAIADDKELA